MPQEWQLSTALALPDLQPTRAAAENSALTSALRILENPKVPGKLNLLSRWPGEGLGGVVALEGLDDVGKGAGEEGVEDAVEDGLLLESRWLMAGGCSCRTKAVGVGGLPCRASGTSLQLAG